MKKYTDKQKIKVLKHYEWHGTKGYTLPYESPETATNIVLAEQDVKAMAKKSAQWYFSTNEHDWFYTMDEAWDSLTEDIGQINDLENDSQIEAFIDGALEKLK